MTHTPKGAGGRGYAVKSSGTLRKLNLTPSEYLSIKYIADDQ